MKRTRNRFSGTRSAATIVFGIAAVGVLVNFTSGGSGWARAAVVVCYYDRDEVSAFPIAGSEYQSTNGTGFGGAVPVEILSLSLTSPPTTMGTVPLPPPGGSATVDSFFDIFTELSVGGGSPPVAIDSFFDITYRIAGGGGSGGSGGFAPDGTWPIELLSMNLTGNPPGLGPIMIRESPTLASVGQHTLHPMPGTPSMPGGELFIDSFFDVFTELSLDGGQTWTPADAPLRMTITGIVPEPGTIALAMLGVAGCGMLVRRRRTLTAR
jgi:hypothetical protein